MTEFLIKNFDYSLFMGGVSFILLATMAFILGRRKEEIIPWRYGAVFSLLYGLTVWLQVFALGSSDSLAFKSLRTALGGVSFIFLLELGRAGTAVFNMKAPGRWVLAPFLAAALAGGISGIDGLNASIYYFLGFPGAVWTGWVLWRYRLLTKKRRATLTAALIIAVLFALALVGVPPPAPFPPASFLNERTFMSVTGFPVQLFRGGLAITMAVAAWRYARVLQPKPSLAAKRSRIISEVILVSLLFMVISAGWIITDLSGKNKEDEERRNIIALIKTGAASLDPGRVARLTGTAADLTSRDYLRLKEQMVKLKEASAQVRFYYLMRLVNGKAIFLVDSEPENSPDYSPPGQVYDELSEEGRAAFTAKDPAILNPEKDRWGTWISAAMPIITENGLPAGLLGFDIEAARWNAMIARERLMAILIVIFFSSIALLFYSAQRRSGDTRELVEAMADEQSLLLNTIATQVWYLSDPETYGLVNEAHAAFLGRTVMELNYRHLRGVQPNDETWKRIRSNREVFATGRRMEMETEATDSRGSTRILKVVMTPKLDGRGRAEYVVCTAEDITDRKLVEMSLRNSEERYRLIADNSTDVIWTMSLDGRFQYVSPSVAELTGFTPDEVKHLPLDSYILPEYIPGVMAEIEKELRKPLEERTRTRTLEAKQYAKDGSVIDIEVTTSWIYNDRGEPVGIQGATRDIRQRKRAEEDLARSLEEKGVLLRELQHRVKNSFTMMVGLVDLESHRVEDAATKRVLERLRDRMLSLSELYDLLYRSEDIQEVRLDHYLDQVCRSIVESYSSESGRIALAMELDEVRVKVKSAIPIGLIVNELLTNALKYAFPGGRPGTITVILQKKADTLHLEVSDNGVGISPDGDAESPMGMGSQLIRMMIQQLRGTISIESRDGTVCRFEIPREKI